MTESPRRRSDAEQNRARIIEVARAVIADSAMGSEALKLNAIAKQAGVGQGTLYRHFPTREDLILAVYRHDVQGKTVGVVYFPFGILHDLSRKLCREES